MPRSTCRSLKLPSTTLYSWLGRNWLLISIWWPLRLYIYTLRGQITRTQVLRNSVRIVAAIMACVHMCLPFWYRKVKNIFLKFINVLESEASIRGCTMTSDTFESGRSMPRIYALQYVLSSQNSILTRTVNATKPTVVSIAHWHWGHPIAAACLGSFSSTLCTFVESVFACWVLFSFYLYGWQCFYCTMHALCFYCSHSTVRASMITSGCTGKLQTEAYTTSSPDTLVNIQDF